MPSKLRTVEELGEDDSNSQCGENSNGDTTGVDLDGDMESEDGTCDISIQAVLSKRTSQFVKRFLKGFGSGIGVYSGIKFVTALMRNPFRERLPLIPRIRTEVLAKDCIRFAAFLGLYPSLYDLTLELLEYFRGKKDGWNSGVAGGVAALAMAIEDRTRRRVYCLFALARAIGALISTLVRRNLLPDIPYSETILYGACSSFLVYCTALKPEYLFPGYYRSVLKWSHDYSDQKLTKLFRESNTMFMKCEDVGLHPGNCEKHAAIDFLRSVPGFAKLYLPIHVAPFIFFKYRVLFKRPKRVIKSLIRNVFWSTTYLATMVIIAKYVICLLRNLQHRPPPLSPWIPSAAGFASGLGLLFERPNRRKELALFLIPHTLYAVYLWAKENRIIRHVPNSSIFLFALAMVPIMHAYEREPESLSLLIHSALKFFVGRRQSTIERKRLRKLSEMST